MALLNSFIELPEGRFWYERFLTYPNFCLLSRMLGWSVPGPTVLVFLGAAVATKSLRWSWTQTWGLGSNSNSTRLFLDGGAFVINTFFCCCISLIPIPLCYKTAMNHPQDSDFVLLHLSIQRYSEWIVFFISGGVVLIDYVYIRFKLH